MRLKTFIVVIVLLVACVGYATLTNSSSSILSRPTYITSQSAYLNPLYLHANEVEDILEGTTGMVMKRLVEVFTADDTLTAVETGKVCVAIGLTGAVAGAHTLTLPPAAAGLTFTFVDANAVIADDLWITAGAG